MRRFLIAFLCFSTLVMTQNVVASTPSSLDPIETQAGRAAFVADLSASPVAEAVETQSAAALLLLAAGLAGLSAAGTRASQPVKPPLRP